MVAHSIGSFEVFDDVTSMSRAKSVRSRHQLKKKIFGIHTQHIFTALFGCESLGFDLKSFFQVSVVQSVRLNLCACGKTLCSHVLLTVGVIIRL